MVARNTRTGGTTDWTRVETSIDADLHSVVQAADGTYALGEHGTLAADHGDGWEVVVERGPAAFDDNLDLLAVTADGARLWFAGDSGALACYDTNDGQVHGYRTPGRAPSRWDALDVAGPAGSEDVLIADDSGYVRPFSVDGYTITWDVPERPTNGDAITAIAMTSDGYSYAIDESGNAARRTEHGWDFLDTMNPHVTYHDIHADPSGVVYAAATDRRLYRLDGEEWTHLDVSKSPLVAVDVFHGRVVALSKTGSVYSRPTDATGRWDRERVGDPEALHDVELGYPDVAVGDDGAVFERSGGPEASTDGGTLTRVEAPKTAVSEPRAEAPESEASARTDQAVTAHDIEVQKVDEPSNPRRRD